MQNAKIYETLEKLINKGLATYIIKGKIKHFQPTNPKVLIDIYEEKKLKIKETAKELSEKINNSTPQQAKIYEGIRAIKSAFYELYNYIGKNSEYLVFPIGEQLATEELQLFWTEVLRKQKEMKIKIRTLPNKNLKKVFENHYKQYPLLTAKYTSQNFPTGIFIFKDHVFSIIWKEKPIGFLIQSKENYTQWKDFFEEQWKTAKN